MARLVAPTPPPTDELDQSMGYNAWLPPALPPIAPCELIPKHVLTAGNGDLSRRVEPCGTTVQGCCAHAHEAALSLGWVTPQLGAGVVGFEIDDAGCCDVVVVVASAGAGVEHASPMGVRENNYLSLSLIHI